MDPITIINRMTAALAVGDRREARVVFEELRDFIEGGGRVPVIAEAPTVTFPAKKPTDIIGRAVVVEPPLTKVIEVNTPDDAPGIVTGNDQGSILIDPDRPVSS